MQKAINHTMNFFIDGERPKQGLDEVDKLLIRKRELLRKCGEGRDHLLTPLGITDELLCATRAHLVRERELDVLCPAGEAPYDHQCRCLRWDGMNHNNEPNCVHHDMRFEWKRPVIRDNEIAALQALHDSFLGLRLMYNTTVAEDIATAIAAAVDRDGGRQWHSREAADRTRDVSQHGVHRRCCRRCRRRHHRNSAAPVVVGGAIAAKHGHHSQQVAQFRGDSFDWKGGKQLKLIGGNETYAVGRYKNEICKKSSV